MESLYTGGSIREHDHDVDVPASRSPRTNSDSMSDQQYVNAEMVTRIRDIQAVNTDRYFNVMELLKDIKEKLNVMDEKINTLDQRTKIIDAALRAIHMVVTTQRSVVVRQEGEPHAEPVVKEEGQDEVMASGSCM